MKKFYLFGMAALLCASLFVLGCKTDADDDGGAAAVTFKIKGLTVGTEYYVVPVFEAGGGLSASGYNYKSAVADTAGVVTVTYTSDDIANVWGEECYIAWHTENRYILDNGKMSKDMYKMETTTITLNSDGSKATGEPPAGENETPSGDYTGEGVTPTAFELNTSGTQISITAPDIEEVNNSAETKTGFTVKVDSVDQTIDRVFSASGGGSKKVYVSLNSAVPETGTVTIAYNGTGAFAGKLKAFTDKPVTRITK